MTAVPARLEAALRGGDGTVEILLANRSGHPETFFVSGVEPEVYIGLDGNARYSVNLSPKSGSAMVEVRHEGPEGDLLAYRQLDTPEDDADVS